MSTGGQSSRIDDLAAFTAKLDGLRADQDPDDLSIALRAAFKRRKLYDSYVSTIVKDTERAKVLLEAFDKALQTIKYDVKIFKRFRQLCGETGLLPNSHIIPEKLVRITEYPTAFGGFSDVWEGIYNEERAAIKALRIYKEHDVRKVRKLFCKEVAMWKRISHPNVVPFFGVSETTAPLCIVSEWMPNGNVRDYVRKQPESSRLQMLFDICSGLSFLHSLEIVHGDLKGDNILIDKSGRARLNDFGFTSIASQTCTETSATGFRGSHRWMAPELFNIDNEGKTGLSTRKTDIFALGMVTIEVFTGQIPFPENNASAIVIKRIIEGDRPSRPLEGLELGLSDELWEVVRFSLAHEAEERPSVSAFVDYLETATPDVAVLEELTEFDAESEGHIQKLCHMFEYEYNTLLGMREAETLVLIEVFDRVLNSPLDDSMLRSRCLYGLQKISARCGLLPKSHWVSHSGPTEPSGAAPFTGRVASTCQRLTDGGLVAVKTISPDCIGKFSALKHRLCTHAVMWKRLRHPNVVSFLGFGSEYPPFSLVYPWMPNGSVSEYLREHPDADKLGLLLDLAQGLSYLHRYNLIHGSLAGHNVLVDSGGVGCISEYGLEIILREEASPKSIPTDVRWMAPEVLSANGRRVPPGDGGKAADVYSFGMVMFEILTDIAPFSNESDKEIVNRVTTGLRPEWPPNNLSQELVDELREQVEACWNNEPSERPTAHELLALFGEAEHRRPVVSVEDSEDGTVVRERGCSEDSSEKISPTHKGRRRHRNSHNRSESTLVSLPLLSGFIPPHQSEGGAQSGDGQRRRFSTKVEKYVRSFFNLPKHPLVTATTGVIQRPEMADEKPAPRTEIIDRCTDEVMVRDDCVPYIVSRPIPEGKTLRKVFITVISKDQGWSNYVEDYGTYRNSWTWFELSVGSPTKGSAERWRGVVVRNLHAHDNFKEHTIEMSDVELYDKAESGDVFTVWARARFPGWTNMVKEVTIRCVFE